MPDRPKRVSFPDITTDHGARIRALERLGTPPDAKVIVPGECMEMPGEGTPDEPYRMQPQIDPSILNQLGCTDLGLFVGGSQSVGWDAVVDSTIVASDPDSRLFKGIGEALIYLQSIGLTRAFVLVRPGTYTETANVVAPAYVNLVAAAPPDGSVDSLVGYTNWVTTWDTASFTMTATHWKVNGIKVMGGGAKSTMFVGTSYWEDCWLQPFSVATGTEMAKSGGRSILSTGIAVLYRCSMASGWLAFTAAYDCDFRIYTNGTYNPSQFSTTGSDGLFWMSNCQVEVTVSSGSTVTWTVPKRTYIHYTRSANAPGGVTWTISAPATTGVVEVINDGGERCTVTNGTAGGVQSILRGEFQGVTLASSGGARNIVEGAINNTLDITGPALVDVSVGSVMTVRGTQVLGQVQTRRTGQSSGAAIDFIAADRCNLQVASPVTPGGSGTFKPYAFDASSDDNVMLWQRHNTYPAAGTDAGTNNRVLPEGAAPPAAGFAPADATYLVTTADATLTNEVPVGLTPNGELGGTWAAITVDATHSGSAHSDFIAKALAAAKGDIFTATANDTPAILTVGADTFVLVADSTQATGLRWANVTTLLGATAGWGSITNVTPDKVYDANATTVDELADVLGTLIANLVSQGVLAT